MREFTIINAKGKEFDMQRDDAFFANPDGLGTKENDKYTQIGNTFIKTEEKNAQKTPQGYMYFRSYEQYEEFVDIVKFKPLILKYEPYEGKEQFIKIGGYELQKGEIDHKINRLKCKFKMKAVGTWYLKKKAYKNENGSSGKVYPYTYDYTYTENASGVINIINESNIEAYVKITIIGPALNPSWVLMQNGEVVQTGKINMKLAAGHRLIINSDPEEYEIAEYDSKEVMVEDQRENSDFSTDRFIYAPPGESKLSFSHEEVGEMRIWAEVSELVE